MYPTALDLYKSIQIENRLQQQIRLKLQAVWEDSRATIVIELPENGHVTLHKLKKSFDCIFGHVSTWKVTHSLLVSNIE